MRIVLQRVSCADVRVEGEVVGAIGAGWLVLLGIGHADTEAIAQKLIDRIVKLRAFEDDQGKLNLSAEAVGAEFLVVSQFTLYADLSRGRRPSFVGAAPPSIAAPLVDRFVAILRERGFRVATGRFGAMMDVDLVNQGPVTFVISDGDWT